MRLKFAADQQIFNEQHRVLPGRVLLILTSGTALAPQLVAALPDRQWSICTFEDFYYTKLQQSLPRDKACSTDDPISEKPAVEIHCLPDLPDGPFQTVVLPTSFRGSSELARDLLQQSRNRLDPNGRLITATDNPRDKWLHGYLKDHFGKTTVINGASGVCYVSTRGSGEQKQKSFDCEYAFRDGKQLVKCFSRPGVFSHRRVDGGARALVRSMDLLESSLEPKHIVEMGSGCGAVTAAAALRFPGAQVLAIDSHARATQSTKRTAQLNGLENVEVLLTADGRLPADLECDLFLCNPPYYSDFRISELFLQTALDCLKPGGRIHLVTKLSDWHENRMIEILGNAERHTFSAYDVLISCVRQ